MKLFNEEEVRLMLWQAVIYVNKDNTAKEVELIIQEIIKNDGKNLQSG